MLINLKLIQFVQPFPIMYNALNQIRMYNLGCPKMHLFPWNIPWPGAKESLSDVGFENIFVFLILFIPRASNCKKPFRGFSEILLHNIFLWIYIIFHILTQPKNPRNFFLQFSAALFIAPMKKICACAQCIFWFWFLNIARSNSWRNQK